MILHLDPDEPAGSGLAGELHVNVERRPITGEAEVASTRRVLELDRGHLTDATAREPGEGTACEIQVRLKLAEQVERHRLARQKVVEDAGLAEELAPAADGVEHLAADDLARRVGEEVEELLPRDRHR